MESVKFSWCFAINQIVTCDGIVEGVNDDDIFIVVGRSTDESGNQYFKLRRCSDGMAWAGVPASLIDGRVISEFRGKYAFLSNFYEASVQYDGLPFHNNEAAFQSAKILEKQKRMLFCGLNPSDAKRLGRRLKLRPDWEQVKTEVMEIIVRDKFARNPDLKERLLATSNTALVESNTWGDTCWGVCKGEGENRLGHILMQVRNKLAEP